MENADILSTDRGAKFYRGDLHIHSTPASHDVSDTAATPEAIVRLAQAEGLDLIAIADHNEISGVAAALSVAEKIGILVVPAVELSTPHGHLLCYFETLENLTRFFSSLSLADRGNSNSRCSTGLTDCLDRVASEGGFAVLAHVDGGKGLETVLPGNPPHKKDIIGHRALLGVELTTVDSSVSYSDTDPDQARRSLGRDRITSLQLGQSQFLARMLNSDSHSLKSLGRNATNQKKVTRYKMQEVSFVGLRMALDDSDARVRIEDEVPATVPMVRAINLAGGFLNNQFVHFGPNLNCIIGGRGTGKSTMFEALRVMAGQSCGTDVLDSDAWPDRIDVAFEDKAGQTHWLSRAKDGDVENEADPLEGPVDFPVECYGQGETQAISQKAQTDPAALLEYLDRFIDIEEDTEAETLLLNEILDLQGQIEETVRKVERIPQYERDLGLKKSQLTALEKANAKDVIALVRRLESEKQVRISIQDGVDTLDAGVSHADLREAVTRITSAAGTLALQIGKKEFEMISAGAQALERAIDKSEGELKVAVKALSLDARARLAEWRAKAQTTTSEIEEKRKALASQNIQLDMAYINKLTSDEAALAQTLTNLKTWVPHLKALRSSRVQKLKARWQARGRIAMRRAAFAQKSSATLKSVLRDLQVSLKFVESAHSPEAERIIVEAMNWRTSQVPRASILVEKLTVPKLLDAIETKIVQPILDLRTQEGMAVFNKAEADAIVVNLGQPEYRFRLERAPIVDRPSLTVTRPTAKGVKPLVRDFSRLSLGQQQSVLLALMLSVDTDQPLIIDQPEDNLDSEFIYQTLVPVLRRAKERRQVIVVTHNANIAVLGDAEQIIVLKSNAELGAIVSRGSIDHPATKSAACKILEGSEEAFRRRARIYGLV